MTGTTRRLLAGPDKFDPKSIGNLAAAYDFTQPSTTTSDKLRASAGGSISLCADTSGNSNVNVLANATASPALTASLPTGVTVTTGQFTVSARFFVPAAAPASSMGLPPYLGPGSTGSVGADSLVCVLETTGKLSIQKRSAANGAQHVWLNIADFQATYGNGWHTLTIRRGAAAWALFVDGVAFGGASVAYLAENVDSTYLHVVPRSSENYSGSVAWSRIYSTGLSDAEVLADALGAVQANNVVNCDFSIAAKFAASFACGTGQTVTITGAGAQGARICGARDVVNLVAASMPTLLPWSGVNYGYLNGVAGNYFSTPDSATLDITGDIDIAVLAAASDWTPANVFEFIAKYLATGDQRSYELGLSGANTGVLRFVYSTLGTSASAVASVSTAAPTIADGAQLWVRVTRNATTGDIIFYTAPASNSEPTSWTKLGNTVASAPATIHAGTAAMEIGSNGVGTSELFSGKVYRALVKDGIAGTTVADFDPTRYVSGTTVSDGVTPATLWTLNGGATIVTGQCAYTDGVDDFLKSAPWSCVQPVTDYYAMSHVSWTSGDYLIDGNTANSLALIQTTTTPQINLNAGSSVAANTELALRTPAIVCIVSNGASSLVRIKRGVATTGDAGAGVPNGITIGASATPAAYGNACYYKILRYSPVAHSAETQNRIIAALARELRIPLT